MNIKLFRDTLESLGLKKGDNVQVANDMVTIMFAFSREMHDKSLLFDKTKQDNLMDEIIDCFQSIIGQEGTLIFPTYWWGWCHGETFDYRLTMGETGMLSNRALSRTDFKRTFHPIYSFAVWGSGAEELLSLRNTESFAKDSPFGWMHKNNNKTIGLDTNRHSTFLHYVEESLGVSYRYVKKFKSEYIDEHGIKMDRTYSMYVRDLNLNFEVDDEGSEIVMKDNNALIEKEEDGILFKLVDYNKSVEAFKKEILENQSKRLMLYLDK